MAWHQIPESQNQFVGTVRDASFKVRRDIRPHRSAFLPFVWGELRSTETGTRVTVSMFMNPLVAIFMLFWLGILGGDVLGWLGILGPGGLKSMGGGIALLGMFILGIVFIKSGFFDEARMARRIISSAILDPQVEATISRSPFRW